ncbi:MAG: hypothetical protein ACLFRT_08815 [Actinomycetota bacterium]
MGTFSASLRTVGDVNSLAATIELSEGRLRIAAGDTEIGDWPLTEIHLEEIPTGYRMAVEGELLLLEFNDMSSFTAELEKAHKKKRRGISRKKKTPTQAEAAEGQQIAPTEEPTVVPPPAPVIEHEPVQVPTEVQAPKKPPKPGVGARILDAVDSLLLKGKKRFGAVLPDWVFSRGIFVIAVALLAVFAIFPGVASTILLVVGGLGVLFGAVVYSDPVLASRWLPGRATPQQALLTGLAIFLVGILLGVIAR